MKHRSIIHTIKFDGDILKYHFGIRPMGKQQIEFPMNILIDYCFRSYPLIKELKLLVNKYHYGQSTPRPTLLRTLWLLSTDKRKLDYLIKSMDQILMDNMAGKNLGLNHISADEFQRFYQRQSSLNMKFRSEVLIKEQSNVQKLIMVESEMGKTHKMAS